jgi:Carbamoyl-phosphate synthase L chain, ATP binding domain
VEVQVFGDAHGTVVHPLERECSEQRRHQKVLEEAPSPVVDEALRARMTETAVALIRELGYVEAFSPAPGRCTATPTTNYPASATRTPSRHPAKCAPTTTPYWPR